LGEEALPGAGKTLVFFLSSWNFRREKKATKELINK
jgi:hypothetical protein